MMNTQAKKAVLIDVITTHQEALREALWELSEFEYSDKTQEILDEAVKREEQLTSDLAFVKSFITQEI